MFSKQCGYGVSKQRGQWPYGVASDRAMKMASDLKPATSITLASIKESICMLLLKATSMASKALVASKQPLQATLRFEICDLNYPWYPYAYCLWWAFWWPLRPWWPPNDLEGHIWGQAWIQWPQLPMFLCFSGLWRLPWDDSHKQTGPMKKFHTGDRSCGKFWMIFHSNWGWFWESIQTIWLKHSLF